MKHEDVIAGLLDPAPCFVCENLTDRSSQLRYRVPLVHHRLVDSGSGASAQKAARQLAALPDMPSTRQLRVLLQDNMGVGLWAPKLMAGAHNSCEHDPEVEPDPAAALVVPPGEWDEMRAEFAKWQFDGLEAAFDGLPYSFDDTLPFASLNYSPDLWYLVLRGPMAGNVCWWTHDGDSVMDEPWAVDVKSWADRLFAETPRVLCGITRFRAHHSIDPAPENADLFPVEYRRNEPAAWR